jgi:hypothetical protein
MVILKLYIKTLKLGVGHQLLDAWHAYLQHLNQYDNHIQYVIDQATADFSILLDYMGDRITNEMVKEFDIVLMCNGGEPLSVASPRLKQLLTNKNVFLIANSYLKNHELQSKVIWFPDSVMTCRDYWTKHFYPQYFDNIQYQALSRKNTITVINGKSRAHRKYFFDMLFLELPNLADESKLEQITAETLDSQWETDEDTEFKHYVNSLYQRTGVNDTQSNYYNNSISIGADNKFGSIPPGYFHLPLYYKNSCVIFPEANWQNNELSITEKSLKCFYSQSIPFPISGAFVNQMYNELGFYTAWNLLPKDLQIFDNEKNHQLRYRATITAIKWLYSNPEVFQSQHFKDYVQQNKIKFLDCSCDIIAVEKFNKIMKEAINYGRY